jgi:hypothetical protein
MFEFDVIASAGIAASLSSSTPDAGFSGCTG